jgi:hypothetical protein
MTARIFNTLLGTWLFFSAFAWPHRPAQGLVAMICGVLTVLTALAAIYYPRVRYMTAMIAAALFIASIATASSMNRTVWHNAVIAIVIFVAALFDRGTFGAGSRRWRDSSDRLSEPMGTR